MCVPRGTRIERWVSPVFRPPETFVLHLGIEKETFSTFCCACLLYHQLYCSNFEDMHLHVSYRYSTVLYHCSTMSRKRFAIQAQKCYGAIRDSRISYIKPLSTITVTLKALTQGVCVQNTCIYCTGSCAIHNLRTKLRSTDACSQSEAQGGHRT